MLKARRIESAVAWGIPKSSVIPSRQCHSKWSIMQQPLCKGAAPGTGLPAVAFVHCTRSLRADPMLVHGMRGAVAREIVVLDKAQRRDAGVKLIALARQAREAVET